MSNTGVQPTGFVRKSLAQILSEIEQQMVTEFGPGVIQTSQSPLGQINGLFADRVAELWELAEEIYSSIDPDQAEETRLNTLGRLRLLPRPSGLGDADYRKMVTNQGVARVTLADIASAVRAVPGVSWSHVFVNETGQDDENGIPPNTIAVAAIGGTDEAIANVINRYLPPGISSHGNRRVTALEDGYCRSLRLVRPIEILVDLTIRVFRNQDRSGCPSPSPAAIGYALSDYLTKAETRLWNGESITNFSLRSFIEGSFEGVQLESFRGSKTEFNEEFNVSVPIAFFEIAKINSVTVEVLNT